PETPWPTGYPGDLRAVPVRGDLDRALDLIQAASQPVVLAGSGAFFSGAGEALAAFAERTGIPVPTTSAARGLLDDDHPRRLGSLVHGGIALASADAALVLGSRFNANLVFGGLPLFPPGQSIVQVDIRPEHLGGLRRPEVGLVGDVGATLQELTRQWTSSADRFDAWTEQARIGAAVSVASWDEPGE